MIENAIADDAAQADRGGYGWLSRIVAGLFGLLYAYSIWAAISNLVELPTLYRQLGLNTDHLPWWVLWIGVLVPIVVFAAAVLIGWRRTVIGKALIFFTGLAVTAGLGLGVIALEEVLRPVLVAIPG